MNVLIFGATGMVGQGVLRECLLDQDVARVATIGRSAGQNKTGLHSSKHQELVHPNLWDYSAIASNLSNVDACFFCLGVASTGMKESEYERVTYGITVAAAATLARLNPKMTFIFVSGAGADSSEKGRLMWARVKGKTENAILNLPFQGYVFRPAAIEPSHGEQSRTPSYRIFYTLGKPFFPWLRRMFPAYFTSTEQIGRAMLSIAKHGTSKRILEIEDINKLMA